MIQINHNLKYSDLVPLVQRLFDVSAPKITRLQNRWNRDLGTPVFTIKGQYTSRGWTEWTQGFQFGSALLQFEVTGDEAMLDLGRRNTVDLMGSHLTHNGVH